MYSTKIQQYEKAKDINLSSLLIKSYTKVLD